MQSVHFLIIKAKLFCSFLARFVPPAIGKQHAANIKKQDFYMLLLPRCLNFAFLIFNGLQQFFKWFIEFLNPLIF